MSLQVPTFALLTIETVVELGYERTYYRASFGPIAGAWMLSEGAAKRRLFDTLDNVLLLHVLENGFVVERLS